MSPKAKNSKSKKVLILTSRIGGGHESVAQALLEHCQASSNLQAKKVDLMREANKMIDAFWIQTYKFQTIATPTTYGAIYGLTKNHDAGLTNFFELLLYRSLKSIYEKFQPQTIFLTHSFQVAPSQKLKRQLAKKGQEIQLIEIITDFKSHALHVGKTIDKYIVASDFTRDDLMDRGVIEDKILVCGIPVKADFEAPLVSKNKSDKLRILVAGGSLGALGIKDAVKQILQNDFDLEMVVLCGRNRYLKKSLQKNYAHDARVKVLGFSNEVRDMMDWADLLITKPGGITITEAIYRCLPMLIPYSYSGQERENLDFLLENDLAIYAKNKRQVETILQELMIDRSQLERLRANLQEIKATYSVKKVLDLI